MRNFRYAVAYGVSGWSSVDQDDLGQVVTLVDVEPKPLDRVCHYGDDTGFRAPPAPDRDTSDLILARIPPTTPRPAVLVLDWSSPIHYGGQPLPCRCCGRGAYLRDGQGRPCHKVCAELEGAHV